MLLRTYSTAEAGIFVMEEILSMALEHLNADRRMHQYGVDSLTAVGIRNWISKTFAVPLSTFEILWGTLINNPGLSVAKKCENGQVYQLTLCGKIHFVRSESSLSHPAHLGAPIAPRFSKIAV